MDLIRDYTDFDIHSTNLPPFIYSFNPLWVTPLDYLDSGIDYSTEWWEGDLD